MQKNTVNVSMTKTQIMTAIKMINSINFPGSQLKEAVAFKELFDKALNEIDGSDRVVTR
jgi:hypothetical protein